MAEPNKLPGLPLSVHRVLMNKLYLSIPRVSGEILYNPAKKLGKVPMDKQEVLPGAPDLPVVQVLWKVSRAVKSQ
jgi:hypothetical protein